MIASRRMLNMIPALAAISAMGGRLERAPEEEQPVPPGPDSTAESRAQEWAERVAVDRAARLERQAERDRLAAQARAASPRFRAADAKRARKAARRLELNNA